MFTKLNRITKVAFACLLVASLAVVSSVPAGALNTAATLNGSTRNLPGNQESVVTTLDTEAPNLQTDDVDTGVGDPVGIPPSGDVLPTFFYPESVLWDNGPLITHPAACGGMDASRLQTDLLMTTLGFGHQFSVGNRMADDFTISSLAGWQIDQITFFAYQTGAPVSPSPITGVYYQIWDGPPDDPGSNVIFGDLTTNRLVSSSSPNMQRDSGTSPCANNRYIFADVASAGVVLPPGTYWIDWMTDGNLTSGPWAPPITILGQTTTGNALQFTTSSGTWGPANDTGTLTQQGMPFVIDGDILDNLLNLSYLPITVYTIVPAAPVLNAISNADGDGTYTVSWSSSVGAVTYTLEEDDNGGFSSPTTVYSGSSTSAAISGRDIGTYYYRVRASNPRDTSNWSNVQSVVVTVPLPECPQAGPWTGTTSQGRNIQFVIENSPQCQIAAGTLKISVHDSCGYNTTTTFSNSYPITNNHFDTGGNIQIIGDFPSATSADGTFIIRCIIQFLLLTATAPLPAHGQQVPSLVLLRGWIVVGAS